MGYLKPTEASWPYFIILSMIKKNEGQLAKENNWKGKEIVDRFGVPSKKPKK